jgi:hypothetical protein
MGIYVYRYLPVMLGLFFTTLLSGLPRYLGLLGRTSIFFLDPTTTIALLSEIFV